MDGPLAYLDTWALHAILLISPPNTSNSLIAFVFLPSRATSELLPIARIPTIHSCGPGTAVPARPFQPQEPPLPVTLEASCQIGSSGR
ncbi:hypothetical protein QWA68_008887 [Fusarium oxysporum]|nr:hypothetical protein QWA68_008887 [Fusarium oxysporum]